MIIIIIISFVANIDIPELKLKNSGFGRSEYEALKTGLYNIIEHLLQDEKYVDPIKETLKIFLKHGMSSGKEQKTNKENVFEKNITNEWLNTYNPNPNNRIPLSSINNSDLKKNGRNKLICRDKENDILDDIKMDEGNALISDGNNLYVVSESNFQINSSFDFKKYNENSKEKDLIILELEKLIIDMMIYNKVE